MSDSNLGSSGIFQADGLVIFMGYGEFHGDEIREVMGSLWEFNGNSNFQGFSRKLFFELWPYDVPVCLKKLMAKLQVSQT